MIRTAAPLALLAAVATPVLADPPVEKTLDAAKVFALLDKFYAAPPADRSLLALRYTVMENGAPASHVRFTLVAGGKRTPMPIGADGRVERLPTPAELNDHAQVALEAPKGTKLSIKMAVETTIRPAVEVSPGDCAKAINQYNNQVKRQAGILALAVSKAKACTFPGSGSGVAVMTDGKTQPLTVVKGMPAFEPEAARGAKTVRLAKAPTVVSLE